MREIIFFPLSDIRAEEIFLRDIVKHAFIIMGGEKEREKKNGSHTYNKFFVNIQ